MRLLRASSLAFRINALTIAVGIVLSIIAVNFKVTLFENRLLKEAQREASTIAEVVALSVETVESLDTLKRYIMMLSANPSVMDIHIVSGDAPSVIASSKFRLIGKSLESTPLEGDRENLIRVLYSGKPHFQVHKSTMAYVVIIPAQLHHNNGAQRAQPAAVMVGLDYSSIEAAQVRELIFQTSLFVILILFSALTSRIFIIKKVIRPLRILKNRIREEGDLVGIGTIENEDEIQSLVRIYERYASALKEKQSDLNAALIDAQKLAEISENTNNGIVICNPQGRIEWINPAFARTTGFELDEIIGKTPGSFLQGENTDQEVVKELRQAISNASPAEVDILNYDREGKEYWIRLCITPLFDGQGKLKNFIAIQNDISIEKEREIAIIEAKDAAESLARAKTDFLATMSHEIRTPMNGIIGMLDLLSGTELDKEQTEFTETASSCSETLLSLINDILDYSKYESIGISLESVTLDLRREIREVYTITSDAARQKDLKYDLEISDEIPDELMGDPVRLRQLLINLTANAIKFTASGSVTVSVEWKGKVDDQHMIEFKIVDTGIGIDANTISTLFSPFTQAESSTTREYGGTGLGLAICKQICEAMGSRIDVSSTLGEGSTFQFVVPFQCKKTTSLTHLPEESTFSLENLSVLVAEDSATQRKTIAQQLLELGCEVKTATNGEEALAETGAQNFDLILMGCEMPKIDGFEATRRILARDRSLNRNCRIIALVGVTEKENIEMALKVGMKSHLTKPVSKAALVNVIAQTDAELPNDSD